MVSFRQGVQHSVYLLEYLKTQNNRPRNSLPRTSSKLEPRKSAFVSSSLFSIPGPQDWKHFKASRWMIVPVLDKQRGCFVPGFIYEIPSPSRCACFSLLLADSPPSPSMLLPPSRGRISPAGDVYINPALRNLSLLRDNPRCTKLNSSCLEYA